MAVKQSYKIPASLDENYFDMEITLKNKDGIGLRPFPIRVILFYVGAMVLMIFIVFSENGPFVKAGIGFKALFMLVFLGFTVFLGRVDDARQMRVELIPALFAYLSGSNRNVITRKSSRPSPFYGIVGIENITRDGVVEYMDGTYGYWYGVVGSASILLFPEDRDAILSRVDDFYKKMQNEFEFIFITTKEPQKVSKQKAHIIDQHKALQFSDPDMNAVFREHYTVLKDYVGKEFKSIHQYLIIKARTREALSVGNNIVINEYENSHNVFKELTPLYRNDIEDVLKKVYSEGE